MTKALVIKDDDFDQAGQLWQNLQYLVELLFVFNKYKTALAVVQDVVHL